MASLDAPTNVAVPDGGGERAMRAERPDPSMHEGITREHGNG